MGENQNISSNFNYELFYYEIMDFDTTNKYELASTLSIMSLEIILFFYIIENFRKIFYWYFSEENIKPNRLICINFNLLLSVCCRNKLIIKIIVRILDHLY